MGRKQQQITAVLHLPKSQAAVRQFEKVICSFYSAQVEKNLHSFTLSKHDKIKIVELLMEERNT